MSHRVLVALAEDNLRRLASDTLRSAGHAVHILPPGEAALEALEARGADVLLVDSEVLRMPAATFLAQLREAGHATEVIYLVSYRALGEALGAMRAGAFGFVSKPIDWEEVRLLVERAAERRTLRDEVDRLRDAWDRLADRLEPESETDVPPGAADDDRTPRIPPAPSPESVRPEAASPTSAPGFTGSVRFELSYEPDVLVGVSESIEQVRRFVRRMTEVDAAVLLEGPRGAGRTQVARALHFGGPRAGGPLLEMDGAEVRRDRAELELRGVARGGAAGAAGAAGVGAAGATGAAGAPGAAVQQPGLIERAHGGTLVIRHPDFLPREAQERLYGYLNSGIVVPYSGDAPSARIQVDTRLIFVSERPLARMLDVGSLLPELGRMLESNVLAVPPLRERLADLPALSRVHLARMGLPASALDPSVLRWLEAQGWPGNLRQFEEVLRRAVRALVDTGMTRALHLEDFNAPEVGAGRVASGDITPDRREDRETRPDRGTAASSPPTPLRRPSPDALTPGRSLRGEPETPPGSLPVRSAAAREARTRADDETIRLPARGVDLVDLEKQLIREALDRTDGNQTQAARLLGLSRQTLIYRMQKYGIER